MIVAGACISRRDELRAALIDASGGAVSHQELEAIVAGIRTELERSADRPRRHANETIPE